MKTKPFLPLCWSAAAAALCLAGTLTAETVVVINEFKSDSPGSDTGEFLELLAYDSVSGDPVPHFPLDGYVVVFFNGAQAGNPAYTVTPVGGTAAASLILDGMTTTAAGFFVIGSPGVPRADIRLSMGSAGWFQNGADGVGLYQHPTTEFTTTTSATSTDLVDAIVYGTDDAEDTDLLEILTPGASQINETPNSVNSLSRLPDGGAPFARGGFVPQAPTPGSLNQPVATLTVVLAPPTLAEGGTREGTVSRDGSPAAAVSVTFTSSDLSEVRVPAAVEIPAGSASVSVNFEAMDDLWPDGTQSAEITATAPGYLPGSVSVSVTDNGDALQPLVINEVFATGHGDANQDGAATSNQDRFDDEFVEIVNRGPASVDLSGYQLFTSSTASVRHTIPGGTVLPAGGALVVFGGGAPAQGMTAAFGTAWIQTANAPVLGTYLIEPAARLSLLNPAGQEIAGFSYENQSASPDSVTLSPDVTGNQDQHAALGDGSIFFSPGTRVDGTAFVTLTAELAGTVAPGSVVENAGPGAAALTVRREAPFTHPLVVTVLSNDPTEAVPSSAMFTIAAGEATGTVPIDIVDDTALDGTQTVIFTCIAAGHLNGTAHVEVTDDGHDTPPLAVYINEIDSDQPGPDRHEFIELYVGEPAARALDGFIVVLFNGNHPSNGAYAVHDLNGRSSNAQGFFVLGNAAVPNVDLIIPAASIQNGADAVAVYRAPASAFTSPGDPKPPSRDGLIDAVVYGNASGQDFDLSSAFQHFSDPPDPVLIQQNEGETNNLTALARRPDATSAFGTFVAQAPTPGTTNLLDPLTPPVLTLAVDRDTLVITFTGRLEQSSTLQDGSFASVAGAVSPHVIPLPTTGALYFRATTP